ncbi:MAG: hypothetical protein IJR87_01275 [Bacteroidaceae bacterium]|nr:hypothetical protein [Bacteroidaceae bacterium]
MVKNIFNKYIGLLTIGAVIMAVPGCTDSWDDHYINESGNTAATQTLWEIISTNPNMTKFATIAKHAKYYKDDTHPVTTYTYADMLNSGMVNTVWAPEDSDFPDAEYQKWLQMCETNGYNVQQQFMGNHIALWRHAISDDKVDSVKMINGKNLIFDKKAMTMEGIAINSSKINIPAVNGTLHIIKGITPFRYNFYEYLKYGGELKEMGAYVVSRDTTYFSETSSIEGIPDKNGRPTYVDSVYFTTSLLRNSSYLPSVDADKWLMAWKGYSDNFMGEDSTFVMLLLTDAAWNATIEKLKPHYQYASTYEDMNKQEQQQKASTVFFTNLNPDSLQDMSLKMDITTPGLFNIHKQPKIGGVQTGTPWTIEHFIQTKGQEAEYLLNTRYDTLRSIPTWNQTDLFNGELKEMSNGYAYLVNQWAFPKEFYFPDVEVEVGGSYMFYNHGVNGFWRGSGQTVTFSNNTYSYIAEKYGRVSKNNYYRIAPEGSGVNLQGQLRLYGNFNEAYTPSAQVMSGKYDIYMVMVPDWYYNISRSGQLDSVYYDSAYVDSIAQKSKYKMKLQVKYNNGGSKDATSKQVTVEYDGMKVDTLLVMEDFEFPYSYKNIRYSYPLLIIQQGVSTTDIRRNYTRFMNFDRVILKSKEDGSEIEVAPKL